MKSTVITNEVFFEPIKIELVIETPEDLYNLLIRLNMNSDSINKSERYTGDYPKNIVADDSLNSLWNQLDDIAAERGLVAE